MVHLHLTGFNWVWWMGIFPRTTKIDESKSQPRKNTYHRSRHQFTPPASSSPAVPDNTGDLDRRFDLMVPEKKIGSCLIHPMKGQLASNINYKKSGKWRNSCSPSFLPTQPKKHNFTSRVELTTLFSAPEKTPTQLTSSKINLAGTHIPTCNSTRTMDLSLGRAKASTLWPGSTDRYRIPQGEK